jgi:hypothetical protein
MVAAIGARWRIEEDLQASKALGLDHSEVRCSLGWYRHITLVLLAYAFLVDITIHSHLTAAAQQESGASTPLIALSTSEARHPAFPSLLAGTHFRSPDLSVVALSAYPPVVGGLLPSSPSRKSLLNQPLTLLRSFPGTSSRKTPGSFSGRSSGSFSFLWYPIHARSDPMTVVSVAEAAHHLGIDGKTLHRWLADAQLPLQCHPHDGRKKEVRSEHLRMLARLHQRSLTALPEVPPAPVKSEVPPSPAALLDLSELLSCLQTQVAALHQQVAALTRLLLQHEPVSATPAAPTKPSRATIRPSNPAPQTPRSRPLAKTPRKPVHVLPRVEYSEQGH